MPRQDPNDPNRQRPSRRDASQGVYNQLGALQQQQVYQVGGQAAPGVQQGQVYLGGVSFGQGANVLQTTPNTSQQLANVLNAVMTAGQSTAQVYNTVATNNDQTASEKMQQALGEAEEQFEGSELESKKAEIYKKYQEEMMLNRSKSKLNEQYYNARARIKPLEFDELATDFKLQQLTVENGDYGTEQERIDAMVKLKEEWTGIFDKAFKDNELLLKRGQILLQGYTGNTNDVITSVVNSIIEETMGNLNDHIDPFVESRLAGDPTLAEPGAGLPTPENLYDEFTTYLAARGVALPTDDPELGPLIQERIAPYLAKQADRLTKVHTVQRNAERYNGFITRLNQNVSVLTSRLNDLPVGEDLDDLDGSEVMVYLNAVASEYDNPVANRAIADQIHKLSYAFGSSAREDVDAAYDDAANYFIEQLPISKDRKDQILASLPKARDWSSVGINQNGVREIVSTDSKTNEVTINVPSFRAIASDILNSSQLNRRALAPEVDASLEMITQAYSTRVLSELRLDQDPIWRTLPSGQGDQALLSLQQLIEQAIDQSTNLTDAMMYVEDGLYGIPEVAAYPQLQSVMLSRTMQLFSKDPILQATFSLRDNLVKDVQDPSYTFDFVAWRENSNLLIDMIKESPYANYDPVNMTLDFTRPLSPEQVAINAMSSEDKFGSVLDQMNVSRIPYTLSAVQYADATVNAIDGLLLQESPVSVAMREGSEQDRRERFKEVINRITGDQQLSAEVFTNIYQGYLSNLDNFDDPVKREEYKLYVQQQVLDATTRSRTGTRMWNPITPTQLELESEEHWKGFAVKAGSAKGWQDTIYEFFDRDTANSLLIYLDTQVQGNIGLQDVKQFFESNGFTWDGQFVVPTISDHNDRSHMSNHQVIAFGSEQAPGTADRRNVAKVGAKVATDLIPYFQELGPEADPVRLQEAITLLSLPWDNMVDTRFTTALRNGDLEVIQSRFQKQGISRERAVALSKITYATFSPMRGLSYRGLSYLDQYVRGNVSIDDTKGVRSLKLTPRIKNGGVYFSVPEQISSPTGPVIIERILDLPYIYQGNTSGLPSAIAFPPAKDMVFPPAGAGLPGRVM